MKPIEGWDSINEAGELKKLPAGPQAVKIIEVVDVADKEYFDVYFDIVEGEFKGYFAMLQANTGKNYGRMTRSYKANALPFFKAFITAVEKSNPGYKWNWDEKTLNGKFCVVNFREEEYEVDGEVRVRANAFEVRSLQTLRAGEIKVPPLKKLDRPVEVTTSPVEIPDDELPF